MAGQDQMDIQQVLQISWVYDTSKLFTGPHSRAADTISQVELSIQPLQWPHNLAIDPQKSSALMIYPLGQRTPFLDALHRLA